jgi:hypothetical protein
MVATGLLLAIVTLVFLRPVRPADKSGNPDFHELLSLKFDADEMGLIQSLFQVFCHVVCICYCCHLPNMYFLVFRS